MFIQTMPTPESSDSSTEYMNTKSSGVSNMSSFFSKQCSSSDTNDPTHHYYKDDLRFVLSIHCPSYIYCTYLKKIVSLISFYKSAQSRNKMSHSKWHFMLLFSVYNVL